MLVVFSPTFLGGTNIIFGSNLGAPLKMRDFYKMENFTLFPKLKLRIQLSISVFLIFIFIILHLYFVNKILTLSRRRPLSYRNQTDIYMITASVLQGLIWCCNGIRTRNHLVCKRTLKHSAKLASR